MEYFQLILVYFQEVIGYSYCEPSIILFISFSKAFRSRECSTMEKGTVRGFISVGLPRLWINFVFDGVTLPSLELVCGYTSRCSRPESVGCGCTSLQRVLDVHQYQVTQQVF